VSLCPPRMPHYLIWARTRAPSLGILWSSFTHYFSAAFAHRRPGVIPTVVSAPPSNKHSTEKCYEYVSVLKSMVADEAPAVLSEVWFPRILLDERRRVGSHPFHFCFLSHRLQIAVACMQCRLTTWAYEPPSFSKFPYKSCVYSVMKTVNQFVSLYQFLMAEIDFRPSINPCKQLIKLSVNSYPVHCHISTDNFMPTLSRRSYPCNRPWRPVGWGRQPYAPASGIAEGSEFESQ
jgi:hypothetical protein